MASPAADHRWGLIVRDLGDAVENLAAGGDFYPDLDDPEVPPRARLVREKAFQKLLQDGYSSVERALHKVLDLYGEPLPEGRSWRSDLLRLATAPGAAGPEAAGGGGGGPAFAPALAQDFDRLRRFRHVAVHN